jgi:hypothetical protein
MEKKLIPLEKESPVLKLYPGNYEKSLDLKSKLDSLEIKLSENYQAPKVAWEYRIDETQNLMYLKPQRYPFHILYKYHCLGTQLTL